MDRAAHDAKTSRFPDEDQRVSNQGGGCTHLAPRGVTLGRDFVCVTFSASVLSLSTVVPFCHPATSPLQVGN